MSSESLGNIVIAGYQLVELLGEGGWSWVFRGKRLPGSQVVTSADVVAIKLLKPTGASAQEREDSRRRFLAEAEAMKKLRHPNIVSVLAYGEDQATDLPFIILPFISGGSIASLLARNGALPLDQVVGLLGQIASALDYAHTLVPGERPAIIHRDVKPANVLLDGAKTPYLSDFGIARVMSSTLSQGTVAGIGMGSLPYMAPEQIIDASSVGPSADIYSLGMTAYEMVAGRVAFIDTNQQSLMRKQFFEAPPSPSSLRPDLPEPAAAAILRALAKDPASRFSTASEFAKAFADGIRGVWHADPPPIAAVTPPIAQTAPHRSAPRPAGQVTVPAQPTTRRPRAMSLLLMGSAIALLLVCSTALVTSDYSRILTMFGVPQAIATNGPNGGNGGNGGNLASTTATTSSSTAATAKPIPTNKQATSGAPIAPTATLPVGFAPTATVALTSTDTPQPIPTSTQRPTPTPTPYQLDVEPRYDLCAGTGGPPWYFPSFQLTNPMSVTVPFVIAWGPSGQMGLALSPSSGTIQPGGTLVVAVSGTQGPQTPYSTQLDMDFYSEYDNNGVKAIRMSGSGVSSAISNLVEYNACGR